MKHFKPHLEVLPEVLQWLYPQLQDLKGLGFVLYGGTGLALQLGHRQSLDFEFFSADPLDRKRLREALPSLGENTLATQLLDTENIQTFEISHPALNKSAAKVSFFGNIDFGRVGEPRLTDDGVLLVASPLDLFAVKLKEIIQRPTTDDYVDIVHLIKYGESLLEAGSASVLFGTDFSPMISLRALSYLDDLEPPLSRSDASFLVQQVSNTLISLNIKELGQPRLASINLGFDDVVNL